MTTFRGRGVISPAETVQYGLLVALAAIVATRFWQDHPWWAWALVGVTAVAWAPELRRGRMRRWWFAYVWGIFVYTLLRAYADETPIPTLTAYPIAFDRAVLPGPLPVEWLQGKLFDPENVDAFDWASVATHWSFFIAPHAAAVVIAWRQRALFARFVALVVGTMYLGLVLFYAVPTAPPWLAATEGELTGVFRVMDFAGGSVSGDTYEEFYDALGEPNSVAAMPSIHIAVTFALFLWAARYAKRWAMPAAAYSAVMAFALVYLAEHYIADLAGGVVVALVAWVISGRLVTLVGDRADSRAETQANPTRS